MVNYIEIAMIKHPILFKNAIFGVGIMKGFKLKDGSIWTVVSYDVLPKYENLLGHAIPIDGITEVTGVQYHKDCYHTYPYKANLSDCLFDTFKADDPRIECIVNDVFDLIGE